MAINKVKFGNQTLIDLTDTTATADKILTGFGAYGKDGVWMDGTASTGSGAVADTITQLPNGGDHHNVYGVDLTQDTVAADKLLSGYTAHNSAGTAITGTYVPAEVPKFTAIWYNDYSGVKEVICNKTYQEVFDYVLTDGEQLGVFVEDNESRTDPTPETPVYLYEAVVPQSDSVMKGIASTHIPYAQIAYYRNGEITVSYDDIDSLETLSVTQNGTYTPSMNTVINEVSVNVQPSLVAKTVTPTAETQIVTPTSTSTVLVSDSLNNYYELKAKTTSDSSVYKCRNFVIPNEMAETFSTFPNTYHLYLSFAKRTCPYAYAEYGKVIIDTDLTFTSRSDVITIPINDSDNWMTNVVVSITSSTILHMVFNFNSDVVSSLDKPCIYIVNPDATFNSQYGWYASASATAEEYDEAKYLYNYATQTYYGLSQVTVNGDADLVAGNIKKDVNIFGVTGTYEGSGGGDFSTATVTLINNVAWPGPSIIATGAIVEDDPDYPLSVINAWCSTGATNAIQVIMFKGHAEIKVEEENSSTHTITASGDYEPGYGGTYIVTGDCTFTMA